MKDVFIRLAEYFELTPKDETAGEAIQHFRHDKKCPGYGKGIIDSAEYLQVGSREIWIPGDGGTWGGTMGCRANRTFIQCRSCQRERIFQER